MPACPECRAGFFTIPVTQSYPHTREFHGVHFSLLAPLESSQARFTFTGIFQNREVVWDCTLFTLARYHTQRPASAQPTARTAFLEIGGETTRGRTIVVTLDIPHIDEPALLRTIIMIRNYKRLQPGRHEFGEPRTFPPH
jgi:hypothetical protein